MVSDSLYLVFKRRYLNLDTHSSSIICESEVLCEIRFLLEILLTTQVGSL